MAPSSPGPNVTSPQVALPDLRVSVTLHLLYLSTEHYSSNSSNSFSRLLIYLVLYLSYFIELSASIRARVCSLDSQLHPWCLENTWHRAAPVNSSVELADAP